MKQMSSHIHHDCVNLSAAGNEAGPSTRYPVQITPRVPALITSCVIQRNSENVAGISRNMRPGCQEKNPKMSELLNRRGPSVTTENETFRLSQDTFLDQTKSDLKSALRHSWPKKTRICAKSVVWNICRSAIIFDLRHVQHLGCITRASCDDGAGWAPAASNWWVSVLDRVPHCSL